MGEEERGQPRRRVATNQAPPLVGHNVVRSDRALVEAVTRHASEEVVTDLDELGELAGSAQAREHGRLANRHEPELTAYDRYGERIDEVRFHPSWHWLMERAVGFGLHAAPWEQQDSGDEHAHVRRAAGFLAWSQTEPGHGCPISMTYAAVPALRTDAVLAKEWTPKLAARSYDVRLRPVADKTGALAGMGMTEKQGGSDVRANLTRARPTSAEGEYLLDGHKWFTSAPMNDVFLVLAQAPEGLTCFLVPRVLPDGARNRFDLVRLKDKLGNRSNASAEVELAGTWGQRLGEEGRGVRTIIEMVAATRLDCVLGSTALMRHALAEASWHVAHRQAFGSLLVDKPLMQNVVADLAVETEAATALAIRLAAAVDRSGDPQEAAFRRIALPLAKFWVCKRAPMMVAEALECLGGNGYIEDSGLPLLYREAPVNSVWEGSGNVNALDVLRALSREPEPLAAWLQEVGRARGEHRGLDRAVESVLELLGDATTLEVGARRLAGQMAACLQGALLLQYAPSEVADAFCSSRLGARYGGTLGTLDVGRDALVSIVARAMPQAAAGPRRSRRARRSPEQPSRARTTHA
ncbi:MAG TPA: acyl-CoA dehydrogenase family protein [Segeticoccus sp.]|uniref:acyl-CoA dehydrogenase family protein n=1 Tax=Segeticoccus sp. TaxID=2706531 RepID=UPI002D7EFC5A|nr:acyl-CoA dehydrogenase family protein [Segeticoccus sp.]HET8601804.1 acyl-CoA dehydrogenase family protein [Segeticoccus sp.]